MEGVESSGGFGVGDDTLIEPSLVRVLDNNPGDISLRWSSNVVVLDLALMLRGSSPKSSSSAAE